MSRYIDGPAVVVSGRVALLLGAYLKLDDVRTAVRGDDPETDETLNAWQRAAIAYKQQKIPGGDRATTPGNGPQPRPSSEPMTAAEVAITARCSNSAVRKAAGLGRIKGRLVGGQWRFNADDVAVWIARRSRP